MVLYTVYTGKREVNMRSPVVSFRVPMEMLSLLEEKAAATGLKSGAYAQQILIAHLKGELSIDVDTVSANVDIAALQESLESLKAQLADHEQRLGELNG